jgi:hypothetical protein
MAIPRYRLLSMRVKDEAEATSIREQMTADGYARKGFSAWVRWRLGFPAIESKRGAHLKGPWVRPNAKQLALSTPASPPAPATSEARSRKVGAK